MAADEAGNDLGSVGVPITGLISVNFTEGAKPLTEEVLSAATLELEEGWQKVGLFTDDGGPQDGGDKDDDQEFFQDGYKLAGKRTRTVAVTLAEMNAVTDEITYGKKPNANGVIVVDDDNQKIFPGVEVLVYKNGDERRRTGLLRVSEVEPDQAERGTVQGKATTFEWVRDETINGFYRQWRKNAAASTTA